MPWNEASWIGETWSTPLGWFTSEATTSDEWPIRDMDAIRDIVAILRATGEFEMCEVGRPEEYHSTGQSAGRPAVFVYPKGWDDIDVAASGVNLDRNHTVPFGMTFILRGETPEVRYDASERLHNVAANAIEGKDLGGGVWPDRTILRRARYLRPRPSETWSEVDGEFFYQIGGSGRHNTVKRPRPR